MKKYIFLLSAALCIALYSFQMPKTETQKPNILFIALDDLKPLLNCYGAKQMHTPNIDRLAQMGTVFMNNYCQQAVCGPTRASLLTGQRPDFTRIWDLKTQIRDMNPDIVTLPQYFKQNGYTTGGIGKVFDQRSVDKGYETRSWTLPYTTYFKSKPNEYANGLPPTDDYYQAPETLQLIERIKNAAKANGLSGDKLDAYMKLNRGPAYESADVPDDAYNDGVIARKAVETIGELAKTKQPFFYAVGFSKPHLPFCAPKKYWDMYDRSKISIAEFQQLTKGTPQFAFQPSSELVNNYVLPNGERYATGYIPKAEAQQKELIHGYYAAVSYADAQVGKLLDALEKQGLMQNTIIVLWGDHGWHLGDHAMWCKHTNFEQATHAPLIIVTPQYKGNQKANGLTEFVDVYPTLTDLAGLKTPDGLAGISLVPVLKNPKKVLKTYAQSQYPRSKGDNTDLEGNGLMGYTIRTKRYRYTAWFEEDYKKNKILGTAKPIAIELYDYKTDPNETENLATKPNYLKVTKEHEKMMTAFLTNQKQSR